MRFIPAAGAVAAVLAFSPGALAANGGSALARGDFNGDGIADLAIGVPDEDLTGKRPGIRNAGAVTVIYGSTKNGLVASFRGSQLWHQNSRGILDQAETGDRFGAALAAGNFNDDDRSDLAVAVPGEDGTGAVHVLYGSKSGLSATGDQIIYSKSFPIGFQLNALFPTNLAWGDFDGDTIDDLAIEIATPPCPPPGDCRCSAGVYVIRGSTSGLDASSQGQYIDWESSRGFSNCTTTEVLMFPPDLTLASGRLAPDEPTGLLIAHPNVVIVFRASSGILAESQSVGGFLEDGIALAVADFDGNGFGDIAVGDPLDSFWSDRRGGGVDRAGSVRVYYGDQSGFDDLDASRAQFWSQDGNTLRVEGPDIPGVPEDDDHFGAALAAADFNGDGWDDLAIGVPLEDLDGSDVRNAGVVNVIYGSADKLSTTAGPGAQLWSQDSSGIDSSAAETGDQFGAVLSAWNFGRPGIEADLAVAVPTEDVVNAAGNEIKDAGLVNVIYGSSVGLRATGEQIWHQNRLWVPEKVEADDHFGLALD